MKIISIIAVVSALALCACDGHTTDAATASPQAIKKDTKPDPHMIQILSAYCSQKEDCSITATFRLKDDARPAYEVRGFSFNCKKGSTVCSCLGEDFCSSNVILQKDGKQYEGTVVEVGMNGTTAEIALKDVRDSANLLVGEGKIYAANEPVPTLPGATVAVK